MIITFIFLFLFPFFHPPSAHSSPPLLVFAGAASKPATDEAARLFRHKTGQEVRVTYGGSGFVLSQMKLARKGDVYFPGSSDFMEKAKREKMVLPETERTLAYLVPAINVQKGNPRQIHSLQDLLRPGIRLAIADPQTVCVGTYAVEVIEKNLGPADRERLRRSLANTVESCEKAANVISLKTVDAVIGWEVFEKWDPQRIQTVPLRPPQVPRIGYLPAAVSVYSRNRGAAEEFVSFLLSPGGKEVFRRHGYLLTPEEARKYALPDTPIGGEYELPRAWMRRIPPYRSHAGAWGR